MVRRSLKLGIIASGLACCFWMVKSLGWADVQSINPTHRLSATWSSGGLAKDLKSWSLDELEKYKMSFGREKDPVTGKLVRWRGILLSHLIEKSLVNLPNENQAQVDLVVLKSETGERALIPRALINKYPILLAILSGNQDPSIESHGRGPLYSVVPWSSKPQILHEDVPLAHFFLPRVSNIELTNYRDQYRDLFLKRRTDPAAMRGEKLFVRNCVGCHAEKGGSQISGVLNEKRGEQFAAQGHPETHFALKMSEKDRKSIVHYLALHRAESAVGGSKPTSYLKIPGVILAR